MATIIFSYVPYWVFVGMSPLLYMKSLGVSLSHFGYYQGVLAFVFAIGSVLFGLVMHRYEQKKMLTISNQIYIASLMSIVLVTFIDSHNPLLITLAFLPFIISQIIPIYLAGSVVPEFYATRKSKGIRRSPGGSSYLFSYSVFRSLVIFTRDHFEILGLLLLASFSWRLSLSVLSSKIVS